VEVALFDITQRGRKFFSGAAAFGAKFFDEGTCVALPRFAGAV
ncbi:MAG: hypothetical protein RLZZ551_1489, partial [Actinomycetota bacterium]